MNKVYFLLIKSNVIYLHSLIWTCAMTPNEATLERIRKNRQRSTSNLNKAAPDDRNRANNSVTKSNSLSRAYYQASLSEKRVMELLISELDPRRLDNKLQNIELKATTYAKTFNVDSGNSYRQISKAADSLQGKKIKFEGGDISGVKSCVLLITAHYLCDEGRILCTFHPDIVGHLVGLQKQFTKYSLSKAVDFKSTYTWRMYEFLISWAKTKEPLMGEKTIDVDELRCILGTPKSYTWGMFDKQCLTLASVELKKKLNIECRIERKKTGRKITSLKIKFKESEQATLPLGGKAA